MTTTVTSQSLELEIRTFRPEDDKARDAFVHAHPRGTFFHLAGWRRAVRKAFRHQERDLVAWRGSEIVGLLPLIKCKSLLGGSSLISMPYAVYGGPLGTEDAIVRALVAEAKAIAESERVKRLELRCLDALPGDESLKESDLYVTYVTDLPEEPDEVLARMPKRSRAEVRKARDKHGLTLEEGDHFADELTALFHQSKRNLGSPGLPAKWFKALREELPGGLVYHAAKREGVTQAVLLSFLFRETVYVYYIGVEDGANRNYSATNYACAMIQQWAIGAGLKRYDLGRSRADSGAAKFKKNQGLQPQPLNYSYHLVTATELPSFNPSNPKTEILQKTWRKLPPFATKRLSSFLSRYLP